MRREPIDENPSDIDITGVIPVALESGGDDTARIVRTMKLVCVVGASDLGRSFHLGATPVVIGRGPTQVQLHEHDISRNHARIEPNGQDYVVEDLQSANGTLVNGKRITKPTVLSVGDRIQVGTTILVLTLQDELEERMRQLQRVEAMTAFAGGLAHDFNNALTIIAGCTSLLRRRLQRDDGLGELVTDLERATTDASVLVKKLLLLGRPEPITYEIVPLHGVIERAVAQLRRVATEHVEIVVDVPPTARVRCSPGELHQAALNLFINARDAMPHGGRLTIVARSVKLGRSEAAAHHIEEGDYVQLGVEDTGVGMDESVAARAFEPFFTTKAPGKGTGLGLAMIHQIVRSHGGSISLTSTPGAGTQFVLLLPAA